MDSRATPSQSPAGRYEKRTRQAGFTLIELLIVLVVLTILVTMVTPSIQRLMAQQRVSTEVLRLRNALQLARSLAITRHTTMTICPSHDRQVCTPEDWTAPLMIVQGPADDDTLEDEIVLRELSASQVVSVTYRNDGRLVRFKPMGWSTGHNGTFEICGRYGEGAQVVLSNLGRIRTSGETPPDC
ncbi:GspH/FimT family pseudopilin [Salinicola sp. LHM]|uniref:GspH/FimT family pseudopilin n=1 Tax=Salinicola sp. LHM TaxID=3065298 RepID=UPI002ACD4829|nr:GspH/FimT family pseudopilin [Salinicola sp. LHM]WQH33402.1 GspH/FimT family pseudopilin [Salinicola sp. LHM]